EGAFELLSAAPSPHGWRLQQAIALGSIRAEVKGLDVDGGRVVAAQTAERPYRADAFVLATGHHIGGGIIKESTPREALLGLAVFHDGRPSHEGGTRLQHLEYLDPAVELRSGLATDQQLRPVDDSGAPAYQ